MPANGNGGAQAAWSGWADALVATLFPLGLGSGQNFAFGQTALVADFANADPQVVNAQVFNVGDTVPSASPSFTPQASLSEAYGFFLQALQSLNASSLGTALANWNSACVGNASTPFNMPAKTGTPSAPGTPSPVSVPTVYLPAYQLDSGFRSKYQEWQAASVAGQTSAGGVIRFSSTSNTAPAPSATMKRLVATTPPAALPDFIRVLPSAASRLLSSTGSGQAFALAAPQATVAASSDCSIEVAFTGLATFALNPGRWFNQAALRLFADQLSAADQARYFGGAGVLARRIFQVVLGFEPSVNLRFNDAPSAASTQAVLSQPAGAAIGIGPITFDAAALKPGGSTDNTTVTIGPTASTLPILLGVVSTDLASLPPVN